MLDAVESLLGSGMGGQLHAGDTLGLWTFNENLYTGRFPLQTWRAEDKEAITGRLLTFLKDRGYEKQSRLEPVLFAIRSLIEKSDHLTVILFSDGGEPLLGTPFDGRINDFYRLRRAEQQRGRMPFITVLRAAFGRITDYTVTAAPLPVEMPAPPVDARFSFAPKKTTLMQPTQPNIATQSVVKMKPEAVVVTKAEATTTTPAPQSNLPQTEKVSPPPPAAGQPTSISPAKQAMLPPPSTNTPPAQVTLSTPVSPPPTSDTPTLVEASPPVTTHSVRTQGPVNAPSVKPLVTINRPPTDNTPVAVSTTSAAGQPKPEVSPAAQVNPMIPPPAPDKSEPPPAAAASPTDEVSQAEPTPPTEPESPMPVAPAPSTTSTPAVTAVVEVVDDKSVLPESILSPTNASVPQGERDVEPPAQTVALVPGGRSSSSKALLVSTVALGTTVFSISLFISRWGHLTPTGSLISRSLRRRKK
jgi:hypothetical protein